MSRPALLAVAVAAPVGLVAYAAMIGLGLHRHASPFVTSLAATVLVFGPPLAVAAGRDRDRRLAAALGVIAWSTFLLVGMPVYFPGERRAAVATGLAVFVGDAGRSVAANLPEEPAVSEPEIPLAASVAEAALPPARPLADHQIALPYEGEGRRLSVPVVFEHGGQSARSLEVYMMLDTGATYTTLPSEVLARLGIFPGPADPAVELHTANGAREASIVLVDRVWLGDLALDGVAVATCDQCAFSDTVGLLGLNVAGGFNVNIDGDRREVIFESRATYDRKLDIKPFVDLSATFTPYPGGRVEVAVTLANEARRGIDGARASVHCGEEAWEVDVGPVAALEVATAQRRLPDHVPCDLYEIGLAAATW